MVDKKRTTFCGDLGLEQKDQNRGRKKNKRGNLPMGMFPLSPPLGQRRLATAVAAGGKILKKINPTIHASSDLGEN